MATLHVALLVVPGVAANLLFAAMFIARVVAPGRARTLGLAGTAMALPLAVASWTAAASGRSTWEIALPIVFVAFAGVEVLVDVVGVVDVRSTRWLWPYLLAFYTAQWAVIGAAFLADERGGYVVLASYFVTLVATTWSYRRVGHGVQDAAREDRSAENRSTDVSPFRGGRRVHKDAPSRHRRPRRT